MSSLRKFQANPVNILNTALSMFRSKNIRTIVVEGVCDKRFISQWTSANTSQEVRFDGLDGKELVELTYLKSLSRPYSDYDFLCFVADVDYDVVVGRALKRNPKFVYNAFCFDSDVLKFNDLESYLINTKALEKLLSNHDISQTEAQGLRIRLEKASRVFGSLRAADILLVKKNSLSNSVLNGLDVKSFFNPRDVSCNEKALFSSLPNWSNYKNYVQDLIDLSMTLSADLPNEWALSRGHDLTEMLALYFIDKGFKGMTAEKIELMLRIACEFSDFEQSPMGKQLISVGGLLKKNTPSN